MDRSNLSRRGLRGPGRRNLLGITPTTRARNRLSAARTGHSSSKSSRLRWIVISRGLG